MNLSNEVYNLKKYLRFSKNEIRNLLLVILFFAFIYSFDDWGQTSFNLAVGLTNLFFAFLLTGSVVLVHHLSQKIYAIHKGFLIEHSIWWNGLFIALLIAFVTSGKVGIYAATTFAITKVTRGRIGHFRYNPEIKAMGRTALWGILGVTFFGGFFKTIDLWLGISFPFTDILFNFAMLFAAFNFLPIPPLDGIKIFFASRLLFVYLFGTMISYVLLINLGQVYSYFWSIFIGLLFLVIFWWFFEQHW